MRSYIFGVHGKKWGEFNPIAAYKRGLKDLDALHKDKRQFDQPNYQHLGAMTDFLVQEGLTIGQTNDWDEMGGPGFIEDMLSKGEGKLSYKAYRGFKAAQRWRQQMTNGLFGRLFAGLKAEAASIELVHNVLRKEKKLGRPLTDAEMKLTAQQVATLINADFGGLHLNRMGRNPDLQKVLQLGLLAPDWTESNWRTVTGLMPKNLINKAIDKGFKGNAEVEGVQKLYRRFWFGAMVKSLGSVALAQAAILALLGDEDDRDEYWNYVSSQFTEHFSKGKWAHLDITPLTRALGIGQKDKRQVFSILGHFKDVFKIFGNWMTLYKHKQSPMARTIWSALEGKDWKGSRFTSLDELWGDDNIFPKLVADSQYDKVTEEMWISTLPSIMMYNLRQSFPIIGSQMLESAAGESSWLGGIARSGGLDLRDVSQRSAGQREYEDVRKEINALDRQLKEAKASKDRTLIKEARAEIKEYPKFNQKKSRMNYARTQLTVVNRKIKGLEAIPSRTPKQDKELEKQKLKKEKIFEKFLKVIKR